MRFRCLIHSGVSSVRWIRSHMEDWPVLLITHFAWKWQRTFLWARSTSSEGCQRTQRSPHGGMTPFPLKAAHLTTTKVTLQETPWVAQTVPKRGNCKPDAPPPPREDKCPAGESTKTVSCICNSNIQDIWAPPREDKGPSRWIHKAVSCICNGNVQDAAHWGGLHPVLTISTSSPPLLMS